MSDITIHHGTWSGEGKIETRVEFDTATSDETNGWMQYNYLTRDLGHGGRVQTDTVTVFLHRWSKEEVVTFVKQQRKALRKMTEWNEER